MTYKVYDNEYKITDLVLIMVAVYFIKNDLKCETGYGCSLIFSVMMKSNHWWAISNKSENYTSLRHYIGCKQ